ncbi:SCO2322 family protein [Streptomyces longispororuber]|uniref:SCO2322 family protein n=1 Tax=Streptomyces longispororuber TaxID=68230 RepID=UPI00167C59BE
MVTLVTLVTVISLFSLFFASPAGAAEYRYWSFWQRGADGWVYATQGPSVARPGDRDVVGFRFAVSADAGSAKKPRGRADFDTICADTRADDGRKRVAVVLDFGVPADAPDGQRPPEPRTACARVAEDGSAADALAAVAKPLRYDSSALLCAISGYPRTGCGEPVSGQRDERGTDGERGETAGDDGGDDGGPSVGLIAGVAAVAALGAAAVWQARRRRG